MGNSWFAITIVMAGCMYGPTNGSTTTDNVNGKTFSFSGYTDKPDEYVYLEILKEPQFNPATVSNWAPFSAAKTSTSPSYINSTVPLYSWGVTAAPVPAGADATVKKRWPQGGIARVRVVRTNADGEREVLTTFDNISSDCIGDAYNAGEDWQTIGSKCASINNGTAMLVSTKGLLGQVYPPHQPYLSDKGINNVTSLYYTYRNVPTTLGNFRSQYGFTSTPSGVVNAKYYNDGDLGLGRDMNCKTFAAPLGIGVACYVRNFSGYDGVNAFKDGLTEKSSTEVLAAMNDGHAPFATVAMTFTPPANATDSVKFMVYDKTGALVTEAQLDYAGQNKSVPNNCLACHGIDATVTNNGLSVDGKAEFLPFDRGAFKVNSTQEEAFRKLNSFVMLTAPPPATKELIEGWYAPDSVFDTGATADLGFTPPGFTTSDLYDDVAYGGVIKPYCRTCHVSSNAPGLDFNSDTDLGTINSQIRAVVCGTKKMPHAERVQKKFFQSGARAYLLSAWGPTSGGDPSGACN